MVTMKQLYFDNYVDFTYAIADKYELIKDEDYNDVAIVAKYEEIRQIIKELLCIGYNINSIEIHDEEWNGYDAEYICTIFNGEVWCEPMLRDTGYFNDESNVTYIMDNCSSTVISYCKSENLYEVSVGDTDDSEDDEEESETGRTYTVNGKSVDKKTFDEYVSKFKETENNDNEDSGYSVTVKVGLDSEESEDLIRDMNRILNRHVSDMFDMLYRPYLYEYRPHPIRLFW